MQKILVFLILTLLAKTCQGIENPLNTIYASYSVRSAKVENCKPDFEIAVGLQSSKLLDIYFLVERVNNLMYKGSDLDLRLKWVEFSHHRRDAKQISSQSFKVGLPLINWKERFGDLLGKKLDEWIGTIKLGGKIGKTGG